ncbi:hypothetical protein Tsubulata_003220 [Turnera subulata]|uniref:Serine aminopeptidase S33 domain-containing protein n=1 Tax=Turnera subulata TaxID=218843 RepID=A0A9Q0GKC5_9ROSI|nr:hypothetical protein Tsubulata_003220 [Turnera subulata]
MGTMLQPQLCQQMPKTTRDFSTLPKTPPSSISLPTTTTTTTTTSLPSTKRIIIFPTNQRRRTILAMASSSPQNPVAQPQRVVVTNKHGEKLVGLLHDTGSEDVIVLCHGFRSTKNTTTVMNLAVALEKEGISAFRFDFSGNGESEGSFAYGNYWREVEDLRAVVEHFGGAKRAVSAILGHSKGTFSGQCDIIVPATYCPCKLEVIAGNQGSKL